MPKKNSTLENTSEFLTALISVGLLLTIAFTALAFGTVEPWSIAIFSFLIVGLILLWGVKCLIERRLILTIGSVAWPLMALMVFAFFQTIARVDDSGKWFAVSLDVEATRLTLEVLGVLLGALLLFASFFADAERLSWAKNFLVVFGLALTVFGLLQKFTWNGKYYWLIEPSAPTEAPLGPFVNRNHFAGYLEMIAPIPVALILSRAVRGELSFFYGFAAALMSVAVFVSLSRGGMISLLTGLLFVVAFGIKSAEARSKSRPWFGLSPRVAAVVLILLTVGGGVWWVAGDAVIERAERTELSGRVRGDAGKETFFQSRGWIWRDTAVMIRENWLVGIGLGAYETAYSLYGKRDGSLIVSQAHNDYLQIVADCGIVGGLLAIWFIVVFFRDLMRAISHRNEMMAGLALGCGAGAVAMLVHSLFDFNLQLPSNALLFLVLTAVVSNIGSAAMSGKVGPALTNRAVRLGVVA